MRALEELAKHEVVILPTFIGPSLSTANSSKFAHPTCAEPIVMVKTYGGNSQTG